MRFDITEKHGDIYIFKRIKGDFDKDYIEELAKKYKFVYKCSNSFRIVNHNEISSHCLIVLSNEDYTDEINFLKSYGDCRYINDFKKVRTLYKIKEKIDEI